jgi:predicted ferric reductase
MGNEVLWYVSRATGIASIVLLTTVLILGMLLSGRRRPHGDQATIVMGMHRWLSLGMAVFIGLHVLTAVVETYVSIDLISVVAPFTSGYSPFWVGLGTIAFDLLLAILVTSWLRDRIAPRTWRFVHVASYAMWPVAVVHGFALGTSDQPILRGITLLCGVAGLGAIGWRASSSHHDRDRRQDILAQEWS